MYWNNTGLFVFLLKNVDFINFFNISFYVSILFYHKFVLFFSSFTVSSVFLAYHLQGISEILQPFFLLNCELNE